MNIDTEKLRAIIPELESWTGGVRRDLDAKIAEACGWVCHKNEGMWWQGPNDTTWVMAPPHYLGTDPSIVTEDMQRVVRESGYMWERNTEADKSAWFCVWHQETELYSAGDSLPLAFARAVIAKEEGE